MADSEDRQIYVRKVTDVHANWSAQDRGEPGKFSYQLILDSGAEEVVIRPTADDADVIKDLLSLSEDVYFDVGRGVLVFNDIKR